MATPKRGRTARVQPAIEPESPTIPKLTEAESLASRRAYERCKPALDAALATLHTRLSRPILPMAEEAETMVHVPNSYYRCADHRLPLDPWGLCHHGCQRCERDGPTMRIWTHKGSCRSTGASVLVRGG